MRSVRTVGMTCVNCRLSWLVVRLSVKACTGSTCGRCAPVRRAGETQALASTISNLFPSGSLNSNMGGTPGHRSRSPTSMPRCRMAAYSVSASGTRNRIPVSAPVSGLAISATDVDAPGAATVTHRKLSPIRTSSRFSKPSGPVKNSTALSWSLTGIPTVPMSVIVVWDMTISSRRWKRLRLRLVHQRTGRGQRLPGFEPRLQAGQDHRPSAVELGRCVRWQLIVDHRQAARVADRLDLPGHTGDACLLGLGTPQCAHRLHEPVRPFDD